MKGSLLRNWFAIDLSHCHVMSVLGRFDLFGLGGNLAFLS